jgi:hypothetical protein
MIIHEQTKNAMEKQEILDTILAYEQELKFNYEECRDAFGHLDNDTQRAWKEWNTMQELLTRLNLQNETI